MLKHSVRKIPNPNLARCAAELVKLDRVVAAEEFLEYARGNVTGDLNFPLPRTRGLL